MPARTSSQRNHNLALPAHSTQQTDNGQARKNRNVTLTVSGVSSGNLCKISVVISLHFEVEDFALWIAGFRNQVFVKETLQTTASVRQFPGRKEESANRSIKSFYTRTLPAPPGKETLEEGNKSLMLNNRWHSIGNSIFNERFSRPTIMHSLPIPCRASHSPRVISCAKAANAVLRQTCQPESGPGMFLRHSSEFTKP